jgi:uncharacterized protein
VAIEPVSLAAGDGVTLEGELSVPDDAWAAAVILHPHPQHGGNMRSLVPGALFEHLTGDGIACLRFNFRGVGGSTGSYGGGVEERRDVTAAVAALAGIAEGLPLVLAGWSFGADVSLAVDDEQVAGWCAVTPTLRIVPPDEMAAGADPRPKLILAAQHDQFRPAHEVPAVVDGWKNTDVEVVAGADHFLVGRTDRVASRASEFVRSLAS